jgi:hypothetical protein
MKSVKTTSAILGIYNLLLRPNSPVCLWIMTLRLKEMAVLMSSKSPLHSPSLKKGEETA